MTDDRIETALKRELLDWFAANPPSDGTRYAGTRGVVISTAKNGREENQDRAIYAEFTSDRAERCFSLFAVLDGIGGMIEGGRCAEIAIASILSSLISLRRGKNRSTLIEALTIANREVWQRYKGRGGATFAGVFFERKHAKSVNVGDSRVYKYDPSRGLARESVDDRLGDQFAKLKGLENVALNPELASRLGQYLGMDSQTRPNIRIIEDAFFRSPLSYLLISTDGAHASGEEFLSATFRNLIEPLGIADALIEQASKDSEADNATVVCAKATSVEPLRAEDRSPFEQLRLWSIHGVFNFVISNNPAKDSCDQRGFKEQQRQKSQPEGHPDAQTRQIQEPSSTTQEQKSQPEGYSGGQTTENGAVPPTTKVSKPGRSRRVKPKVTIKQLTFDSHQDDEASK